MKNNTFMAQNCMKMSGIFIWTRWLSYCSLTFFFSYFVFVFHFILHAKIWFQFSFRLILKTEIEKILTTEFSMRTEKLTCFVFYNLSVFWKIKTVWCPIHVSLYSFPLFCNCLYDYCQEFKTNYFKVRILIWMILTWFEVPKCYYP